MRVAYDITMLADYFNRSDAKFGIARVIEEVLTELAKRQDLVVTAMGLCSQDLPSNALRVARYLESRSGSIQCACCDSYTSRLGLSQIYRQYCDELLNDKLNTLPRLSPEALRLKMKRLFLAKIYAIDVVPGLAQDAYDVFHSTYHRLPPTEVTGNVPRVLTVYDLIPVNAPHYVVNKHNAHFKEILGSVDVERDWIACISEFTKQEFCEYTGMSPERAFVVPLAASSHFQPVKDPERMSEILQQYGIPDGNYFLTVAAPQPRKNLAHLIRCFFRLLHETPTLDANLVLVGSKSLGFMYDEIFAAIDGSREFRSKVIFAGHVHDHHMSSIYSAATAFVFPSLYEGFGLPVLEAMQCGTPVISSNATSLPEVVGGAGKLVDPTDGDGLCQAMYDVLTSSDVRTTLSAKGRKRSEQFSWNKCSDQIVSIYQAMVGN